MDWQPIETAPKDKSKIDIWVKAFWNGHFAGHWRITNAFWDKNKWESHDRLDKNYECIEYTNGGPDGFSSRIITHWMPLPKPPTS